MMDEANPPTIGHQAAISVCKNAAGDVVIKQDGHHGPEEDAEIHVVPTNALALAKAILREAGIKAAILPWKDVLIVNGGGQVLRPFPPEDEEIWLAIEEDARTGKFNSKSAMENGTNG